MQFTNNLLAKWNLIIDWQDALRFMLAVMNSCRWSSSWWHDVTMAWTSGMMTLWSICIWIIMVWRWWKTVWITIYICEFTIQSKHLIILSSDSNCVSASWTLSTSSQDVKRLASNLLFLIVEVVTQASGLFCLFCCFVTTTQICVLGSTIQTMTWSCHGIVNKVLSTIVWLMLALHLGLLILSVLHKILVHCPIRWDLWLLLVSWLWSWLSLACSSIPFCILGTSRYQISLSTWIRIVTYFCQVAAFSSLVCLPINTTLTMSIWILR